MTPSLESGVERRLDSPEEDKPVELIVGVESASDEAAERLEGAGAKVHDELPLNYYSVTTTEDGLETICSLEFVTSVEINSEGTVFESDFRSPVG